MLRSFPSKIVHYLGTAACRIAPVERIEFVEDMAASMVYIYNPWRKLFWALLTCQFALQLRFKTLFLSRSRISLPSLRVLIAVLEAIDKRGHYSTFAEGDYILVPNRVQSSSEHAFQTYSKVCSINSVFK